MSPPKPRRKWLLELLRAATLAVIVLAMTQTHRFGPAGWSPYVEAAALAGLVAFAVVEIRRGQRAYRKLKDVRAGGRWPLGEGYWVEFDEACDGSRRGGRLEIDETEIAFGLLGRPDLALADVTAVRVRPSWIEIESKESRFRVVPRSYADRERLLWELAYRRADAFEFAAEAPHGAPTPAASATDDVADLDRRMTGSGLGSALAGPMAPLNPAPPRKSGLGVGLFVAPPGGESNAT